MSLQTEQTDQTGPAGRTAVGSSGAPDGTRRDGRGLRIGTWVAVALVAVLLAALTAAVTNRGGPSARPLDPTSTTASGSRALVRVLEQRGTDVRVTSDADRIGDGTVFVDDSSGVLAPGVARRIVAQAAHVVLVTTSPAVLEAAGLDAEPAGPTSGSGAPETVSTASCAIAAVSAAGRINTGGTAYTVDGSADTTCAPIGSGDDRAWGIVQTDTAAGDVTLLGTTDALRNDTVTSAGNAALALGLLGGDDRLDWYVPTAGSADAAPTLGELAPPWVPSALLLLAAVAVAAAVWRGRRLGPLVVEGLPVVVRAAETTEGRARLYARTRDRTHALDTLRIAALRRSGRVLGLPRGAHVDEVVRAVAAAVGCPPEEVSAVLVGAPVSGDRALLDAVAALDELERALARAVGGASPGPAPTRLGPTTESDPTTTTTTTTTTTPGGRP